MARGLTAYNASDAERIAGKRSLEIERPSQAHTVDCDEIIHRDDLALTGP